MLKSKPLILIPFLLCLGLAYLIYQQALHQSSFIGIPDVPCLDPTKPIVQEFNFYISVTDQGQPVKLGSDIGHDPGNCLKVIHTNNPSGEVNLQANDNTNYTLEDFFQVWGKIYTQDQFLSHSLEDGHLQMRIDGQLQDPSPQTPLQPNLHIQLIYQ